MKRVFFLLALLLVGADAAGPQQGLVPANMQQQNDSLGFIWDFDQSGGIQNGSNLFSGAMIIDVNSSGFSVQQPMMSADGSEYFLDGNFNQHTALNRRVKLDSKNGFVRYYDTFRNLSNSPQSLRVNYRVQFNNQMQGAISDNATPIGGSLGAKDTGFIVMRQANNPGPSALFLVAGKNSKIRPLISNQQNYRFNIGYTLKLAPGETISLLQAVAQRNLSVNPDAKSLGKLFASINSPRLLADIPAKDRKPLSNFAATSFGTGPIAPTFASALESLNVERGPTDILAIGAETRLKGSASCAKLEVETARGKVAVPFENVAAVLGGRRETRVFLRDGQALTGQLLAQGLKFTLTTGSSINLEAASLDRLVLRSVPGEGGAGAGLWGYVETFEGDRFAVKPDPKLRLRATTAWGPREIPLDELVGCGPSEENPFGFRVLLKDGSYVVAFLDGDEMSFDTVLFGPKKFLSTEIRQIAVIPPKVVEDQADAPPEQARVSLAGGQILAGQIDVPELHFLSPAGIIPVAANLIRSLRNTSEEASESNPIFTATVWGGGAVSGTLREMVVPVRTGGSVFQVPVRDLVEALVPSPAVPEGLRDKMSALVRDLGHADWEKREAASRELSELGGIARAALLETVKQTNDAEVRRRAQALLDSMETL